MPRVFLTPFVLVGLLFLPSCSSDKAKACEAAQLSYDTYYSAAGEYNGEAVLLTTPKDKTQELLALGCAQYYRSQKIILNNPKCFLPAQVVEAQIYLKE